MDSNDLALTLVLVSAFMHASWNSVIKAGKSRFLTLATVDGTALVLCLAALPLVTVPSLEVWLYIALSVFLNTAYRLFLVKAYETGDFGQVYPIMRGVPPVLVAIFSTVFLAEHLSSSTLSGVLLISGGIISLTTVRNNPENLLVPVTMACLAGLFIAGYTVVDAKGVRESDTVLQYIIYLTVFQSIPMPALAVIKDRQAFRQHIANHWITGVFGGVFYLASYGLILFAMSLVAVAKVSALRETSVIIAAVIAAVFFHEGFGLRRFLSSAVILAGILLIKMGS